MAASVGRGAQRAGAQDLLQANGCCPTACSPGPAAATLRDGQQIGTISDPAARAAASDASDACVGSTPSAHRMQARRDGRDAWKGRDR
jgi:hypothetical protein